MTTPVDDKVSTRVGTRTAEWLNSRADRMHTGSIHLQTRTELALWQGVLAAELRRIRLTRREACCIADVLNSSMLDATVASGVGLVYVECFDAFRLARETPAPGESSYGKKWQIDEEDLLRRLAELGPAADHALRDAVSRWWEQSAAPSAQGWAAVGLRVFDEDEEDPR